MKKIKRKMWEMDIGLKKPKIRANIDRFNQLRTKSIDIMQNIAQIKLNPCKYLLSDEAKKRLKWIYIIHFECGGKIAKVAQKTLIPLLGVWNNVGTFLYL